MSDASFFAYKHPYATEQLTVTNTASGLTAALVANTANAETDGSTPARWAVSFPASAVVIEIASESIYYTVDGTTPSSTNGLTLNTGDVLTLSGKEKISSLLMVRTGATSAVVNVAYYQN